jgi:nucleotide-binding universal stress UspA family protein
MSLASRMLVGFGGQAPDDGLVRYAAMVTRLSRPEAMRHGHRSSRRGPSLARARQAPAWRWQTHRRAHFHEPIAGELREIRFVSLLTGREDVEPSCRASVAARLQHHFAALPQSGMVNVDQLKGRPLDRLAALAADFDSDLLLLDIAADSRRKCARLAVEAPCAAWLVPTAWAPVLRRILVPIDFSYRAAASLQIAVELARRFRPAKCIALHVDQHAGRLTGDTLSAFRRKELTNEFRRLMAMTDGGGVRIEPMFVKSHDIAQAIERAAVERAADLTVMICRRRSRLTSAVDPAVAESVIRASSGPLLLLKSIEKPLPLFAAFRNRLATPEPLQYS